MWVLKTTVVLRPRPTEDKRLQTGLSLHPNKDPVGFSSLGPNGGWDTEGGPVGEWLSNTEEVFSV